MEQGCDSSKNIGRRIKAARGLAGISRKDLEDYGISMHTLQSWELGRNPLTEKTASKLIEILHNAGVSCSIQWLLNGTGKSPSLLGTPDYIPYPANDKDNTPAFDQDYTIQKEIEFFKSNNPNAVIIMVSDDTMEPRYSKGDFVGGIQYMQATDIEKCLGQDCILETPEGIYFRRLTKRKNDYALSCLNAQTEIEDPVIFSKKILAATPIIWHRWKFQKPG